MIYYKMCAYCDLRAEIYKLIELSNVGPRGLINLLSDWKCNENNCDCNNCVYNRNKYIKH